MQDASQNEYFRSNYKQLKRQAQLLSVEGAYENSLQTVVAEMPTGKFLRLQNPVYCIITVSRDSAQMNISMSEFVVLLLY